MNDYTYNYLKNKIDTLTKENRELKRALHKNNKKKRKHQRIIRNMNVQATRCKCGKRKQIDIYD